MNDPLLLTSRSLATAGTERWLQSQAVRRGHLERVRRGVYLATPEWQRLDVRGRFVARARAATLTRPSEIVFSHVTAGLLHGLPLVGAVPERLDHLRCGTTGGRSEPGLLAHRTAGSFFPVDVHGVLLTDIERTLVDVASTSPLSQSLVMIDAALAGGLTTIERLLAELDSRTSLKGFARARRHLELGDGRSESPGESLSRARFVECGFALPDLQRPITLPDGTGARVDFVWDEVGLLGEFDGLVKYGRKGAPDVDELWREKRREDALRSLGHGMVRWIWSEAWHRPTFAAVLTRAGVPRA